MSQTVELSVTAKAPSKPIAVLQGQKCKPNLAPFLLQEQIQLRRPPGHWKSSRTKHPITLSYFGSKPVHEISSIHWHCYATKTSGTTSGGYQRTLLMIEFESKYKTAQIFVSCDKPTAIQYRILRYIEHACVPSGNTCSDSDIGRIGLPVRYCCYI